MTSPSTPNASSKSFKKRSKRACDNCKKTKQKCDGQVGKTCSECERRNTKCTWNIKPAKRGRKLGTKNGSKNNTISFWKKNYYELLKAVEEHNKSGAAFPIQIPFHPALPAAPQTCSSSSSSSSATPIPPNSSSTTVIVREDDAKSLINSLFNTFLSWYRHRFDFNYKYTPDAFRFLFGGENWDGSVDMLVKAFSTLVVFGAGAHLMGDTERTKDFLLKSSACLPRLKKHMHLNLGEQANTLTSLMTENGVIALSQGNVALTRNLCMESFNIASKYKKWMSIGNLGRIYLGQIYFCNNEETFIHYLREYEQVMFAMRPHEINEARIMAATDGAVIILKYLLGYKGTLWPPDRMLTQDQTRFIIIFILLSTVSTLE